MTHALVIALQVPCDEFLKIKVMDYDTFSADECMGYLEIDVGEEVAKVRGYVRVTRVLGHALLGAAVCMGTLRSMVGRRK